MSGPGRRSSTNTSAWSRVFLLAGLFSCNLAQAGMFSITPVRIFMLPKDRVMAVTMVNEGDTMVALQADVYAWSQKPDGSDELGATEDLILSPPIIRLAPKTRQVVRLALLRPQDASRQLTYRMVVREAPDTSTKTEGMEVPITLALNLPVFVTPPIAKRELTCTPAGTNSSIQIACTNTGSAYAQIREIVLTRAGKRLGRFEGGTYVLPGARKVIALQRPSGTELEPLPGDAVLKVVFDDFKSQESQLNLPQ